METIICIRGVGSDKAGYARKLCQTFNSEDKIIEFYWHEIAEKKMKEYFQKVFPKPRWYRFKLMTTWLMRKAVFNWAGDATNYPEVREQILESLDYIVKTNDNVSFVTHSLGSLIAYDYMNRYGVGDIRKFVSMGCSIPLFRIGNSFIPMVEWNNYFENNDVMSMPVRPMIEGIHEGVMGDFLNKKVNDIEWKSKHIIKGSNISVHSSYWKSTKLLKDIRNFIYER